MQQSSVSEVTKNGDVYSRGRVIIRRGEKAKLNVGRRIEY